MRIVIENQLNPLELLNKIVTNAGYSIIESTSMIHDGHIYASINDQTNELAIIISHDMETTLKITLAIKPLGIKQYEDMRITMLRTAYNNLREAAQAGWKYEPDGNTVPVDRLYRLEQMEEHIAQKQIPGDPEEKPVTNRHQNNKEISNDKEPSVSESKETGPGCPSGDTT